MHIIFLIQCSYLLLSERFKWYQDFNSNGILSYVKQQMYINDESNKNYQMGLDCTVPFEHTNIAVFGLCTVMIETTGSILDYIQDHHGQQSVNHSWD